MDVYGDNANIITEEIPELQAYMDEVMPVKESDKERMEPAVMETMVDVDEFLLPKDSYQPKESEKIIEHMFALHGQKGGCVI